MEENIQFLSQSYVQMNKDKNRKWEEQKTRQDLMDRHTIKNNKLLYELNKTKKEEGYLQNLQRFQDSLHLEQQKLNDEVVGRTSYHSIQKIINFHEKMCDRYMSKLEHDSDESVN